MEPPTLNSKPECIVALVSLPLFKLYELSFEKVNEDPLSMVAELFEPGGSLKIISGICGPAVTNVCVPSDTPPNKIPSVL